MIFSAIIECLQKYQGNIFHAPGSKINPNSISPVALGKQIPSFKCIRNATFSLKSLPFAFFLRPPEKAGADPKRIGPLHNEAH